MSNELCCDGAEARDAASQHSSSSSMEGAFDSLTLSSHNFTPRLEGWNFAEDHYVYIKFQAGFTGCHIKENVLENNFATAFLAILYGPRRETKSEITMRFAFVERRQKYVIRSN